MFRVILQTALDSKSVSILHKPGRVAWWNREPFSRFSLLSVWSHQFHVRYLSLPLSVCVYAWVKTDSLKNYNANLPFIYITPVFHPWMYGTFAKSSAVSLSDPIRIQCRMWLSRKLCIRQHCFFWIICKQSSHTSDHTSIKLTNNDRMSAIQTRHWIQTKWKQLTE